MPKIDFNDYEILNLLGAFKRMRKISRYGYNNERFDNGDWFNQVLYKLGDAASTQIDSTYALHNIFDDVFERDALRRGRLHNVRRVKIG